MKKLAIKIILYYLRIFTSISLLFNKPTVIGITGSVGKSSVRDMIYAMLKNQYPTKVIKKGNSETGIPLGILGLEVKSLGFSSGIYGVLDWIRLLLFAPIGLFYLRNTQYLIVEMGVDDPYPPKNMEYLLKIIKPHIAIVLNVYAVHAQQFEKLFKQKPSKKELIEKIALEKIKIITQNPSCRYAIYNKDSSIIEALLLASKVKKDTFGKSKDNFVSYKNYSVALQGTSFDFHVKKMKKTSITFEKIILPQAYKEVIAATIILGLRLHIPLQTIISNLSTNFALPAGRSTLLHGIKNALIIDSSYNASLAATSEILHMAYALKKTTKRPLTFVFGDMRELGGIDKKDHEEVTQFIAFKVDRLICIGPLTKTYVLPYLEKLRKKTNITLAKKRVFWFDNALKTGTFLKEHLRHNEILLFKGSQNTIYLEEAIKFILESQADYKKLPRQDTYWMRMKNEFFKAEN